MKTVKVDLGSDSYRIEIGRGLLSSVGEKLRQLTKAEKIAVVTDDHVRRIYGERIREILKGAGFDVKVIAIPAGEASKNLRVFGDVLEALISPRASSSIRTCSPPCRPATCRMAWPKR